MRLTDNRNAERKVGRFFPFNANPLTGSAKYLSYTLFSRWTISLD
jgi:hypothetical protein